MFFIIYYLMGILGTVRMLWETFFQEADFSVLLGETVGISAVFAGCHLFCHLWFGRRRRPKWVLFCLPVV